MRPRPAVPRSAAGAGVVFAVLYVVVFQFLWDLIEEGYTDHEVQALFADPGYRQRLFVGAFLVAVAGTALLWFLAALLGALRRADPDGDAPAVTAFAAGCIYVALLFVSATLFTGYAAGILVGELSAPVDVALARVLNNLGFTLLLIDGLFAAAVVVLITSLLARRTSLLPRWLTRAGLVVSPLLLLGAAYVPQFLVPLWVLAVSAVLLRAPRPDAGEVPAPQAP
jgi:hypothetical protein